MNAEAKTLNIALITKRVEYLNRVIESQTLALRSAWAQRNWAMAAFKSARAVLKAHTIDFQFQQYEPAPLLDMLDMADSFQLTPDTQLLKLSRGWIITCEDRGAYCPDGWENDIEGCMYFESPFTALAYFQANPSVFLPNMVQPVISLNLAIDASCS